MITVTQAAEALELTVSAGHEAMGRGLTGALVGDLLSHIMAQGRDGQLWITIQTHPNIVAVAALAQLAGIVIADGLAPEEETRLRAEEEGIPLLLSPRSAFVLAGELYQLGVR